MTAGWGMRGATLGVIGILGIGILAIGISGIGIAEAAENPLARYRWSARVVVISAPGPDDASLIAQRAILAKAGTGLKERDLVILEAVGETREAVALRRRLGLPAGAFRAALIGKDGGVKRVEAAPLPVQDLYETIDAMPMRRDEMRR